MEARETKKQIEALKKLHGVKTVKKQQGVTWSEDQQKAIDGIIEFLLSKEMACSLIGPAGSGKTTLMQAVIKEAAKRRWNIILAAPTHKAAKQINLSTGGDSATIHKILGLKIKENHRTGKRELKVTPENNMVKKALLVVDEASMISEDILYYIQEAAHDYDGKILFVGDRAQLNPVDEEPSLTVDPKRCEWSLHELTSIHRQAAKNPIIAAATIVRTADHNALPVLERNQVNGAGIFIIDDKKEWAQKMVESCSVDDEVRYLGYTNAAVDYAAKAIRREKYGKDAKHPYLPGEVIVVNERYQDKNYQDTGTDLVVENNTEMLIERVLKDGDLYLVSGEIDDEDVTLSAMANYMDRKRVLHNLKMRAKSAGNWGLYFSKANSIADLRSACSLTVHKSQGSTFKDVFINLDQVAQCKVSRERQRLLYVAITRASNAVYLTGSL